MSQAHHGDGVGGETSVGGETGVGKAGRSDGGEHDKMMQQVTGNGAEKLSAPATSVVVSHGYREKHVLLH